MPTVKDAIENSETNEYRHIVSVSGGKDSTALAIYMQQEYPDLSTEYVFCDTGSELPETYEYLDKLEVVLGKKIQRLNALEGLNIRKRPGRSAFEFLLKELYGGYLPSPRARWCTSTLKIIPFEKYVGEDKAYSYIGIRADEDREGYTSRKPPALSELPNIIPVYPFKDADLGLEDINDILADAGIGLPKYYEWRSRSGCYFCFYQQIGEWQGLKERHPDLYEKAKAFEKTEGDKKFTWVDGRTLSDVEKIKKRYEIKSVKDGCAICHL
ncbi:MAG: phosphoadenosine phosphosulfate reductase [Proteobacteria bacterium]|nr:phosphoadenosine phosphosulfate reductase [Pseudomonadota bacterium]